MSNLQKSEWEDYRERRKFLWISILVVLALALIISRLSDPRISLMVLLPLFAAFRYSHKLQFFKCPRCGNSFFSSIYGVYLPWVQRCLHCHLPKWENGEFVDPDP